MGGKSLPPPGPEACGPDTTPEALFPECANDKDNCRKKVLDDENRLTDLRSDPWGGHHASFTTG